MIGFEPTYVEVLYEKIEEYQADIVLKIIPASMMKILTFTSMSK